MITDDPIHDLERQLVAAAARETAPHPTPPRRLARRWALALSATGALAAVAVALIVLLSSGASVPSLAQAAYTQLNPKHGIVDLNYDTRFYDGGHLYQHARAEVSYNATQERSVGTSIGPRSGRAVRFLEVVRTPREIRFYDSGANTMTIQANCWPSGRFPRSTTVDPIAKFNALFQRHRITQHGTTTFEGRRVSRLVADDADQRFVFLVTPKTGEPVAMTLRPLALTIPGAAFTGTVVRVTSYRHLPLDASSPAQLKMRPHPGAKIIQLGRSRCPHR
jgi:hypothetical protein